MTTQQMIDYTNARLNNWYVNAKLDYNVIGSATCRVEGNLFIVDYTENGVSASWSMGFYEEYLRNGKDYFFNVWSEEATRPQPKENAPVDTYQDLDLNQAAGEPTAEELNQVEGVKFCSFMAAVEANTADSKSTIPVKEAKLTQEQKEFYWNAYHEGYKQAQSELNHIVNP